MTINIFTLLAGDTTYIAKHNQNYAALKSAIEALQSTGGGATSSAAGGIQEIFDRDGIIGKDSYSSVLTLGAGNKIIVQSGAFFHNGTLSYLKSVNVVNLTSPDHSATFYVNIGTSTGVPFLGTNQTSYSIYSVDFDVTGLLFTNLVFIADILFDGDDYQDVLDGSVLSGPYESLSERLDDMELGAVGGGLTNRVYYKEADTQVVNRSNISDSGAWESLGLVTYLTEKSAIETTVSAILRVFYDDSSPAVDTRVRFRKAGIGGTPDAQAAVYAYNTGAQPAPEYIVVPVSSADAIEYWVEASGAGTANLNVYLVGYTVEKTGTGTRKVSYTASGMVVNQSAGQTFDKVGWLDRGLVWFFEVSPTGMSAGTFDVEIYADDAFSVLLYKLTNLVYNVTFQDSLPWFYEDEDGSTELHIKIINNGTGNGTFTVVLKAERFA